VQICAPHQLDTPRVDARQAELGIGRPLPEPDRIGPFPSPFGVAVRWSLIRAIGGLYTSQASDAKDVAGQPGTEYKAVSWIMTIIHVEPRRFHQMNHGAD